MLMKSKDKRIALNYRHSIINQCHLFFYILCKNKLDSKYILFLIITLYCIIFLNINIVLYFYLFYCIDQ